MPTVPTYKPDVVTRPLMQQGLTTQASPEAFGASAGRGMQQLGQGIGAVGEALSQVEELKGTLAAKDADTAAEADRLEAAYGNNGYLTMQGRGAVEGRDDYLKRLREINQKHGEGLHGVAAQAYNRASEARMQEYARQAIVHQANETKTWAKESSGSRIAQFADTALAGFTQPDVVKKNIGAGIMELDQQAKLEGWDPDTLHLKQMEYASGVHKNVALRIAQTDPLAAAEYVKKNAETMTAATKYELDAALDDAVVSAEGAKAAGPLLMAGRKVSDLPGDLVAEVAGLAPSGGPTRSKAFLSSLSAHPDRKGDTMGLQDAFADNLAAMVQDAPPEIRKGLGIGSGYRSPERQQELWAAALKKYGSEAVARKWVAPPGKSQHNEGQAVDLTFNGQFLGKAPPEVRQWVHDNARKYGLYFPMANEPWHIEPIGSRDHAGAVAPRSNTVAVRSAMPSYDDIENGLAKIADPRVRDNARKRVYAAIEGQTRIAEASEKAAKAELWRYIDGGATPDQVPIEVRQAAGQAAVSSGWDYIEKRERRDETKSDEVTLYDMRRYAAMKPYEFANIDLNEYRDRLSKDDIKELTGLQSSALTDQRKAREDGVNLTSAFSQAQTQLEAVGLSTTGKQESEREDTARQIAQFQNQLAADLERFKKANEGRAPNQTETQSMINRLLLPVVLKQDTERSMWNPLKTPWSDTTTTERPGFLFETGGKTGALGGGVSAELAVAYDTIPITDRVQIETSLQQALGRRPRPEEVEQVYRQYLIERQ